MADVGDMSDDSSKSQSGGRRRSRATAAASMRQPDEGTSSSAPLMDTEPGASITRTAHENAGADPLDPLNQSSDAGHEPVMGGALPLDVCRSEEEIVFMLFTRGKELFAIGKDESLKVGGIKRASETTVGLLKHLKKAVQKEGLREAPRHDMSQSRTARSAALAGGGERLPPGGHVRPRALAHSST